MSANGDCSNSDSSKSSVEQSNEEALKAPTMGVQVQVENAAEHCQSNPCDTTEEGKKDEVQTVVQVQCLIEPEPSATSAEAVEFKVIYNKMKYDVVFPLDETVSSLKMHIETITGVPAAMQKVMFKGRMPDECTLREQHVTTGSKIMVIGSTVNDVMSVAVPDVKAAVAEAEKANAASSKEALSKQKPHKTVLDKHGKPDDVMPGIKNANDPLPSVPISGMYNKAGGKVRLTFKLDNDQLWIGTKERTDKIPMNSIKAVVSEPIEGHEDYHLMGIQLGPTEASRYWVYWVPAQYVTAIKDTILGKWQMF